ncbi:hypothetical protein BST97_03615 [Nonlabens spongiae]|uniref:LysM domain-containing protein n=1 Tax=Nonlabens spongiae TaxID=331648 RepID=A0A1W6MI60_9FLAO|nr:LysM peptidoglycan-binding domain-containing protein [Nonlabens spongiae]ARN77149.1 hypothetical protein BST97_03615 [Nonlabens spongiae]
MGKRLLHRALSFYILLQVGWVSAQNDRVHYVEKGETVYAIARKYKVSPKKILQLNPNASDLIQIGQELIIPNPSIPSANPTASLGDFDYYYVEKGDTKFGLSKKFNVSIAELESINPNMVPTLLADTQIRVPKVTTTNITNTEGLKTHYVQKGETLYGIARMYGITLDQLINANIDRLGNVLLAGQTLVIPDAASPSPSQTDDDFYLVQAGDTKYGLSKKFNATIEQLESLNPSMIPTLLAGDRIKIPKEYITATQNQGVVENENSKNPTAQNDKTESQSSDQTQNNTEAQVEANEDNSYIASNLEILIPFSRAELNVIDDKQDFDAQFAKGSIRALDSLKAQGYENVPELTFLVDSTLTLQDKNRIYVVPSLNQKIKNIVPDEALILTGRSDVRNDNLILFENNSTNEGVKTFMLDYVVDHSDNVILINDLARADYSAFAKARYPQISILTETPTKRITEKEIEGLLKNGKTNYIVFNTDANGVMINVTNSLLKLSSRYDIKTSILDKKYLPQEENVSSKRFRILKMIYPESDNNLQVGASAYHIGFETTYDVVRKLKVMDNDSGVDVIPYLKGDKMEVVSYRKVGDRHYQSGSFKVKSY